MRILLYGAGSNKRLEYEEKVLMDIVSEFHGSAREGPCRDETNFMAADAICACVVGGTFCSEVSYESINHAVRYSLKINEITSKYIPRILDDYGTTNWICPYELGYITKYEGLRMASVENGSALNAPLAKTIQDIIGLLKRKDVHFSFYRHFRGNVQ